MPKVTQPKRRLWISGEGPLHCLSPASPTPPTPTPTLWLGEEFHWRMGLCPGLSRERHWHRGCARCPNAWVLVSQVGASSLLGDQHSPLPKVPMGDCPLRPVFPNVLEVHPLAPTCAFSPKAYPHGSSGNKGKPQGPWRTRILSFSLRGATHRCGSGRDGAQPSWM